jgi:hypothetical protein
LFFFSAPFFCSVRDAGPPPEGRKVESLEFPEPPTFFASEAHDSVFVPTLMVAEMNESRVERLNFQLGIRRRDSGDWTYVEGSRVHQGNIRGLVPDFSEGVEFPPFLRNRL